ncbi:YxlC family protein, partial [Paenibacillus forsythiae]
MTKDNTGPDGGGRPGDTPEQGKRPKSADGASLEFALPELIEGLERLDRAYAEDAAPPSLGELQARMIAVSEGQRRRMLREWLLFWLVSLCLLGFSLLAMTSAPLLYWMIQGLVPVA